jgi:hypothetical protein
VIRSLQAAAKWVDAVGLAIVWGKADLVLPSLWDAVGGGADWAVRDESGKATGFSPEFSRVWGWKDELPERRLVAAGRHLGRGAAALVAPRLLPALVAVAEAAEPTPLQAEIVEVVREHGPAGAPEIRRLLGTAETKPVNKAIEVLQRQLVLTNAGVTDDGPGWAAILQDLTARRWDAQLRALPPPEEARRTLARTVLDAAGELSAADLAGVLRWRRKDCAEILDSLEAETVEEAGVRLWRPSSARSARAGRTRRTRGTPSSGTP